MADFRLWDKQNTVRREKEKAPVEPGAFLSLEAWSLSIRGEPRAIEPIVQPDNGRLHTGWLRLECVAPACGAGELIAFGCEGRIVVFAADSPVPGHPVFPARA